MKIADFLSLISRNTLLQSPKSVLNQGFRTGQIHPQKALGAPVGAAVRYIEAAAFSDKPAQPGKISYSLPAVNPQKIRRLAFNGVNALNLRLNKPLRKDSVFPDIGVQLIKPLPSPGLYQFLMC